MDKKELEIEIERLKKELGIANKRIEVLEEKLMCAEDRICELEDDLENEAHGFNE